MTNRQAAVTFATVVGAGTAYLAWLGWNAPYWPEPRDGSHGPYETWQVAGLVLTWTAIVAGASWWGGPVRAVRDATVGITLLFCADNWTRPVEDASLWPIGAAFLAVGAAGGGAVVAAATHGARRRLTPPGSG